MRKIQSTIHNRISCTKKIQKKKNRHKHTLKEKEYFIWKTDTVSPEYKPVFIYTGTMWMVVVFVMVLFFFFSSSDTYTHSHTHRHNTHSIHIICASFWIFTMFWSANSLILYRLRAFVLRITCLTYYAPKWMDSERKRERNSDRWVATKIPIPGKTQKMKRNEKKK